MLSIWLFTRIESKHSKLGKFGISCKPNHDFLKGCDPWDVVHWTMWPLYGVNASPSLVQFIEFMENEWHGIISDECHNKSGDTR